MRKTSEYELGTPDRRMPAAIFLPSSSFLRLVLPPKGKERGPGRGARARTPRSSQGRVTARRMQVTGGEGKTTQHTHTRKKKKKRSGAVSGQDLIPVRGERSWAVPHHHFLPHSNPLCPLNMAAAPTHTPDPLHGRAFLPQSIAGTRGKGKASPHSYPARLSHTRLGDAELPTVTGGGKRTRQ